MMDAAVGTTTEPGDRYLTTQPCCLHCRHRFYNGLGETLVGSPTDDIGKSRDASCTSSPGASASRNVAWIAVKPYTYLFRAPVKGRWLGRGLLELFLVEFAFVPFDCTAASACGSFSSGLEARPAGPTSGTIRSAVVPLLIQRQAASPVLPSRSESVFPSTDVGGGATLDRRFTLPAYIEELCGGVLWLHGREAECRLAGRRYQRALINVVARAERGASSTDNLGMCDGAAGAITGGVEMQPHTQQYPHQRHPPQSMDVGTCATPAESSLGPGRNTEAGAEPCEWSAWCRTVQWLADLSSEAEVDALLPLVLLAASQSLSEADIARPSSVHAGTLAAAPAPLLSLQQRDVVHHLVWRREGRAFAHQPLEIIRCDVAAALSSMFHSPSFNPVQPSAKRLAMLVVSKPPGLPVHPSGCYRKNTVTSIFEDVFGGTCGNSDARRFYRIEEHQGDTSDGGTLPPQPYASIVHSEGGFELIRVWLRRTPSPTSLSDEGADDASSCTTASDDRGVSAEDWAVLKALFMREREATTPSAHGRDLRKGIGTGHRDAAALPGEEGHNTKRPREAEESDDKKLLLAEVNHETTAGLALALNDSTTVSISPAYSMKAFVVHRLDAATSGVLLLGLNSDTARRTAAAISNKTALDSIDDDGDENEDDMVCEDDARDLAALQTPAQSKSATSPSSRKVYCARVHGRVDLASLARQQHHCVLRTRSVPTQATGNAHGSTSSAVASLVMSAAAPPSAALELLVSRPIGCLDHHNSVYWSPDAAITDAWKKHQADANIQRQRTQDRLQNSTVSGGQGKLRRTAEAVACKRERMRQLTRGGVSISLCAVESSSHRESDGAEASVADGALAPLSRSTRQVQQYLETLRSAKTVLEVMRYDAATDQTVVRCTLGTGRTHQLRVHLASLGHPIVRDSKYIALEAHMRALAKFALRSMGDGAEPTDVGSVTSPPLASEASLRSFYESLEATLNTDVGGSATAATAYPDGAAAAAKGTWQSGLFAEGRNSRGCICPEAIDLHAWQYTILYDDGEAVSVEVPLPSWAQQ